MRIKHFYTTCRQDRANLEITSDMRKKSYQIPQTEYSASLECITVIASSGGANYGTDGGDLVGGIDPPLDF